MSMGAKVLNWQELSKKRDAYLEEFEVIRQDTLRKEQEKLKSEKVNFLIQQVPFRFRNKTFDDYKIENESQAQIKVLAERYVKTFSQRLKEGTPVKFMGKHGTGKSFLSLIIYQELARAGYSVKYESSLEFINNLLEIKFKSQVNFQNNVRKYEEVQLLIIDEITESINKQGVPSELEKQLLFKIINTRYENNLCTLVITNRDNQELIARLGNSTVDRLSEKGISLAFNWKSYRQ